jgi:hypothetical protein
MLPYVQQVTTVPFRMYVLHDADAVALASAMAMAMMTLDMMPP